MAKKDNNAISLNIIGEIDTIVLTKSGMIIIKGEDPEVAGSIAETIAVAKQKKRERFSVFSQGINRALVCSIR